MKTDCDAAENWIERRDAALSEIVASFLAHGRKRSKWRISWRPVDADAVARIWLVYGRRGTVFESDGLARITEQILSLIARLSVSTDISGHSAYDIRPEVEDEAGGSFTDKQWERFVDGMEDKDGHWLLSDYGMKPLERLFVRLFQAETDEARLLVVDQVFNVVHQRGDLAAMFISGGTASLTRIANQGGYQTPFADYSARVEWQCSLNRAG